VTWKVLLLSGTSEGPLLARALDQAGLRVHATVTRPEACTTLFGALLPYIEVEARGFTEETLAAFLHQGGADVVLDATHPFAARITCLAHAVCTRLGVPYIRYERPDWEPPAGTHFASTFADAALLLPGLGRCIALAIGSKQLRHFAGLHDRLKMHARILPAAESLAQAKAAGFAAEQLVCARPPFSQEENRQWLCRCGAEVLVTKASGQEGGVVEKVLAARELGMQVLMIRRPLLPDVPAVGSLEDALHACLAAVEGRPP
jgi:precorrin-6A/cobalt-precorrin-6A reductase